MQSNCNKQMLTSSPSTPSPLPKIKPILAPSKFALKNLQQNFSTRQTPIIDKVVFKNKSVKDFYKRQKNSFFKKIKQNRNVSKKEKKKKSISLTRNYLVLSDSSCDENSKAWDRTRRTELPFVVVKTVDESVLMNKNCEKVTAENILANEFKQNKEVITKEIKNKLKITNEEKEKDKVKVLNSFSHSLKNEERVKYNLIASEKCILNSEPLSRDDDLNLKLRSAYRGPQLEIYNRDNIKQNIDTTVYNITSQRNNNTCFDNSNLKIPITSHEYSYSNITQSSLLPNNVHPIVTKQDMQNGLYFQCQNETSFENYQEELWKQQQTQLHQQKEHQLTTQQLPHLLLVQQLQQQHFNSLRHSWTDQNQHLTPKNLEFSTFSQSKYNSDDVNPALNIQSNITNNNYSFSSFQSTSVIPQNTSSLSSHSLKKKRRRVITSDQRRAANIRERRRMCHLNEAFDGLRKRVPTFAYEKKLSRIETLKLAVTYISFMSDLLETFDGSAESRYIHQFQQISSSVATTPIYPASNNLIPPKTCNNLYDSNDYNINVLNLHQTRNMNNLSMNNNDDDNDDHEDDILLYKSKMFKD